MIYCNHWTIVRYTGGFLLFVVDNLQSEYFLFILIKKTLMNFAFGHCPSNMDYNVVQCYHLMENLCNFQECLFPSRNPLTIISHRGILFRCYFTGVKFIETQTNFGKSKLCVRSGNNSFCKHCILIVRIISSWIISTSIYSYLWRCVYSCKPFRCRFDYIFVCIKMSPKGTRKGAINICGIENHFLNNYVILFM